MLKMTLKIVITIIVAFILFLLLEAGIRLNLDRENESDRTSSLNPDRDYSLIEQKSSLIDHQSTAIELTIEEMTLAEKIGQLVMVGLSGETADAQVESFIKEKYVGGIILVGSNINQIEQTLELVNQLKSLNNTGKIPLFLGIDEEGVNVTRFPDQIIPTPTSREIGRSNDPSWAFDMGEAMAQKIGAFGFNINFAPVLDIDSNPNNPVIGNRSFGATPDQVSDFGIEQMKGISHQRIVPVIKHFPGHGDTDVDSHVDLPIINHDQDRVRSFEIQPFERAIDQGAEAIMTGHLLVPAFDDQYPASLSEAIITGLLREELGFEGVVMTDDLSMNAIGKQYEIGEAAVQSIRAGTDLLMIVNPNEAVVALDALEEAVHSGGLSEEMVDQRVHRILTLKEKYELSDDLLEEINVDEINQFTRKKINK